MILEPCGPLGCATASVVSVVASASADVVAVALVVEEESAFLLLFPFFQIVEPRFHSSDNLSFAGSTLVTGMTPTEEVTILYRMVPQANGLSVLVALVKERCYKETGKNS